MRRARLGLAGLVAIGALAGCGGDFFQRDPCIVLVTLDTTRADRLGAMGDSSARTPALDALAARGALFERAYAGVPLTLPSHTSMLTGLAPDRHGVHDNGHFAVRDELETVAERLAARGYDTAAFVSASVLDSSFGLDQGFQVYDDEVERDRGPIDASVPRRKGEVVTERALAWLEQRGRKPFLLWVHYYDVHAPRLPPPPFDEMEDPYAGSLAYADAQVARVLEGVARAAGRRETLVLVSGDHGESLGEHDEPTHGVVAYDSTLHVPLIAAGPGFVAGTRSRALVGPLDVAPTVLRAVGEPLPAEMQGVPLQESAAGRAPADRTLYFESLGPHYNAGWARLAGLRSARWKYTAEPAPVELYDVEADSGERENRADAEPEVRAQLEQAFAELRSARPAATAGAPLDPEMEQRLAALGYLSTPQRFEPGQEPDPRRVVGAHTLVERARLLALEGRVGDSILALEALSESPVLRAMALNALASVYAAFERTADAVRVREQLVALTPASHARIGLANALLDDDRPEEALRVLDALEADPSEPPRSGRLLRAHALLALGRYDEAERVAAALAQEEPDDDAAHAVASQARALRDGPGPEIERLRALLATSPHASRLERTRVTLAELLRVEGRDTEAAKLLEQGGELPPEHRAVLARIAREHGNPAKAVAQLEQALSARPFAAGWQRQLADLYVELGRGDEALGIYNRLIEANPKDAALRVDRGFALFRARRLAEAEADFREALALEPEQPEVHFNLGLVELLDGREKEAERHLLRAVELRPDYGKAHLQLAVLYRRRGDPRAAHHAEQAARFSHAVGGGLAPPPDGGERPE